MAHFLHTRVVRERQTPVQATRIRVWIVVMVVCACSPALNWRRVSLGDMAVTLPCKPDHTQRTVQWGGQALEMEMVGCEADGALFAVSRIHLPPGTDPGQLQAQWQAASLLQMKAQGEPTTMPATSQARAIAIQPIAATGQGSDGKALQARLAWVVSGAELYHLAVYAPQISPEMAQPFFDGITPQ